MEKEKNKKMISIEGWLLFILIIFIIKAILNSIGLIASFTLKPFALNLLEEIGKSNPIYQQIIQQTYSLNNIYIALISTGLTAILTIFLWLTIYKIIKRKEKAKRIAIIALWIGFMNQLFEKIIQIIYMPSTINIINNLKIYSNEVLQITKMYSYTKIIFAIIISLTWAIIWTLYFLKSKRVKNTLINQS